MLHLCHFFLTLFSWSSVDSLLCLLTMGCSSSWDISICCGVSSSMTCSNICSVVALYELQRSICFTMVFFRGCRGISGDLLLWPWGCSDFSHFLYLTPRASGTVLRLLDVSPASLMGSAVSCGGSMLSLTWGSPVLFLQSPLFSTRHYQNLTTDTQYSMYYSMIGYLLLRGGRREEISEYKCLSPWWIWQWCPQEFPALSRGMLARLWRSVLYVNGNSVYAIP